MGQFFPRMAAARQKPLIIILRHSRLMPPLLMKDHIIKPNPVPLWEYVELPNSYRLISMIPKHLRHRRDLRRHP